MYQVRIVRIDGVIGFSVQFEGTLSEYRRWAKRHSREDVLYVILNSRSEVVQYVG